MNERRKTKQFKLEALEKITSLVIAAFGLVAALAWNEAIQSLFVVIFGTQSTLWAKFTYAIVITVLIVFITLRLGKLISKLKEEVKE